jgi:hypothetical protein
MRVARIGVDVIGSMAPLAHFCGSDCGFALFEKFAI